MNPLIHPSGESGLRDFIRVNPSRLAGSVVSSALTAGFRMKLFSKINRGLSTNGQGLSTPYMVEAIDKRGHEKNESEE